ncbi:MAG: protein kinase domain-containing protein [Panacagrimonas sp.]
MKLATGSMVDHYRIIRKLGSGGMADVYEAEEADPERRVALKILPQRAKSDETVQRFRREARSAASLNHRGIVHIYKVGYDTSLDIHYISMRLLIGGDLADRISDAMSVSDALMIVRELASAFQHAHSRGVIHRDVKPANVLFDEQGFPVLTDFGIAKALGSVSMTATNTAIGTPTYMSPEQGSGGQADARSDLYALGVMLYEMLCGEPPYVAHDPWAVMYKHQMAPIPTLPSSFQRLQPLIDTLMAKNPDERPNTAAVLISLIDKVMGVTGPITPLGMALRPVDPQLLRDLGQRTSGKRAIPGHDSSEEPTHILPHSGGIAKRPDSGKVDGQPLAPTGPGTATGPSAAVAVPHRRSPAPWNWIVVSLIAMLLVVGGASGWHFWKSLEETRIAEVEKQRAVKEQAEREQAEREAKEKADREAREKADREAREKADRDAREKADFEAKKADFEARRKAHLDAQEKADLEAKGKADREAGEKAERDVREAADRQAAREKAERDAREREKANSEAREKADRDAREKTERDAREKADREARERAATREAKEKAEREAKEREAREKDVDIPPPM